MCLSAAKRPGCPSPTDNECPGTIAVAVPLVVLLGTVASCGDDDTSGPTPSASNPTISKAEFAEAGNGLCETNGKTISARFEAMSTPPKPEEFQTAYDKMWADIDSGGAGCS